MTNDEIKNIQVGSNYSLDIKLIDKNIVIISPKGDLSTINTDLYYQVRNDFIARNVSNDTQIIEIRDLSRTYGKLNRKTRLEQAQHLLAGQDKLIAYILIKAPIIVKMAYTSGQIFYKPTFKILYNKTVQEGIDTARFINTRTQNNEEFPLNNQEVFHRTYKTKNFESMCIIPSNNILYIKLEGFPTIKDLEKHIEIEEEIFENKKINKNYYRIFDFSELKKTTLKQRLYYIKKLKDIQQRYSYSSIATVVCGANPSITAAIISYTYFFPRNYYFVKNADEAIFKISDLQQQKIKLKKEDISSNKTKKIEVTNKQINDLIDYIGSISWDMPQKRESTSKKNPLKGIYDAIAVVKTDIDSLITEQNIALEELKQYKDNLEQMVKNRTHELEKANNSKSEFLRNVSHELRTPLNGILGFAEIISRSKDIDSQHRQSRIIENETVKLISIINTLLDLSKIEAGKMDYACQPFNLTYLLYDLKKFFHPKTEERDLKFSVSIDKNISKTICGDELKVRQILINLIGNSFKFTEKGYISVNIRKLETKNNFDILHFTVKDSGIGIPTEIQRDIFSKFIQADQSTTKKYEGTGLGTSIAKQLVTLMGGEIGLESTPGKGSTFWFTLPFRASEQQVVSLKKKSIQDISLKNIKVLIVEDYLTNQEIAKYHLESVGATVCTAENGIIALEQYKRHNPDIILMDVQMPVMNGYTATMKIRELDKYIPIVALTANAFDEDRDKCLNSGMNELLAKPIKREKLIEMVYSFTKTFLPEENEVVNTESIDTTPTNDNTHDILDFQEFVQSLGGNCQIAEKILSAFTNNLRSQIDMIKDRAIKEDRETLCREAHSLKGGSLNVGASRLTKVAEELEIATKEVIPDNIDNLIKNIEDEYQTLKEYAKSSLGIF